MQLKRKWAKHLLVGAVCIAASAAGAWSEALAQAPGNGLYKVSGASLGAGAYVVLNADDTDMYTVMGMDAEETVTGPDGSTSSLLHVVADASTWNNNLIAEFLIEGFYIPIDPGDIDVPAGLNGSTISGLSTTVNASYSYSVVNPNTWQGSGEYGDVLLGIDVVMQATAPPVDEKTSQFKFDQSTGTIVIKRYNAVSLLDNTGVATIGATFTPTFTSTGTSLVPTNQTLASAGDLYGGVVRNNTESTMEIIRP